MENGHRNGICEYVFGAMLLCCDVCHVATSLLHFNILVWFYFLVFVCSTSYSSATVEMAYGVYAQLDPTPFCRIQNCGGTFMYLSLFHTQSLALTHAAAACLSPQSLFYVFRAPSEHLASAAQRRCQSHTNMQTPIGTRRHTHTIRLCLPRPKKRRRSVRQHKNIIQSIACNFIRIVDLMRM